MSEFSSELEQLLITKPEGRTTVHTFSSHPTPLEEKNLGTVFGLFETESTDSLQQEIMEGLAREMVESFYHAEQFSPDRALEQSLQHLNQKIQTILPEVGEDWVKQFAGVVAVVHGVDVHFSAVGRVAAFIIQNNQIVDLHEPSATPPQPLKVFTSLLSGKLNTKSTVFFSTETILDFLSKEKLKRTVADKTPERVVQELSQLLADDTTNTNFGAIILRIQPAVSLSPASSSIPLIQPEQVRHDSMYDLVSKERDTRDLLAPSLWQSVKRSAAENIKEWRGKGQVAEREVSGGELNRGGLGANKPKASGAVGIAATVGKGAWSVLKKVLTSVWHGCLVAFSALVNFFRKKPAQRKPLYSSVSSKTTNWVTRLVVWFKSLSLSRKILLIVGILVLFIVAQTVVSKGRSGGTTTANNQTYEQTLSQVDVKINEAKAALLYDNEDTARLALTEAQTLLATIPTTSNFYKEQGQSRADTITTQFNALNHISVVENPTVVGNYNSINPSLSINHLVLLGASLFTFDTGNSSVYRLNTEDHSASVVASASDSAATITAAHKASPGTALVVINSKRLGLLNPVAGSIETVEIDFSNKDRQITDAEAFGTRLYALDAQAGQILRFQQTDGTYGESSQWLTDTSVSLAGAKALAIDGNIYVLQANGAIQKFFGGKPANDFAATTLSPGFEGATDLVTDENTTNLYVLDPTNKRIVVLDKTGKLLNQYTSNSFDHLGGLVVDEANKILYVLNGTTVYSTGI